VVTPIKEEEKISIGTSSKKTKELVVTKSSDKPISQTVKKDKTGSKKMQISI
jgi:hypothetical protein